VQVELPGVRVLLELFGFLLSVKNLALVGWPDMADGCVYNIHCLQFS
jgi:hypothetical protein